MSQENVEIVRRLVDAINADAIPRELFAPDFELRNATTAITDATYLGYEGGLKWRRDLFEGVDDARFVLDEVLATGPDYVVITNRLVGHGSSSGVPIELRWASALWFRDNRIWRTVGFNRRRDALEAVGLSE
jgi:ketosteroid isomerase-like protein